MPGFENTAGRSANGADRVTDSRSDASARTPGSDVMPGSSPQRSAPSISRSSGAAGAPVAQTIPQSRTNVSAVTGSPSVNLTSLRSRNVNVFRSSDAVHDRASTGTTPAPDGSVSNSPANTLRSTVSSDGDDAPSGVTDTGSSDST